MSIRTLFSHDIPLVTFDLQPTGEVRLCHTYEENSHLLPFPLRGKNLQEELPDWLSGRFSENGRWLLAALKNHGVTYDLFHALQLTSALSLTDAFWVHDGSKTWEKENLFSNEFSEEIAHLALSRGMAPDLIQRMQRSPEYTSDGALRKCWRRQKNSLFLLKAASRRSHAENNQATAEWFAWHVAQCLSFFAVPYTIENFHHSDGSSEIVSSCPIFTSDNRGFSPAYEYLPYCGMKKWQMSDFFLNDPQSHAVLASVLGKQQYEDMMLFDTIIGNKDRHMGNYGVLFDTRSGTMMTMAPLFDNGLSFFSLPYETYQDETTMFSTWNRAYHMPFDEQARAFVRERHRAGLERLLDFQFPPSDFLSPECLRRAERYLHFRATFALEALDAAQGHKQEDDGGAP